MLQQLPIWVELPFYGLGALGCWYYYILHAERSVRKSGVPAIDKENAEKLRRNGKMSLAIFVVLAVFALYRRISN